MVLQECSSSSTVLILCGWVTEEVLLPPPAAAAPPCGATSTGVALAETLATESFGVRHIPLFLVRTMKRQFPGSPRARNS